jgi:hypothetical protein
MLKFYDMLTTGNVVIGFIVLVFFVVYVLP